MRIYVYMSVVIVTVFFMGAQIGAMDRGGPAGPDDSTLHDRLDSIKIDELDRYLRSRLGQFDGLSSDIIKQLIDACVSVCMLSTPEGQGKIFGDARACYKKYDEIKRLLGEHNIVFAAIREECVNALSAIMHELGNTLLLPVALSVDMVNAQFRCRSKIFGAVKSRY